MWSAHNVGNIKIAFTVIVTCVPPCVSRETVEPIKLWVHISGGAAMPKNQHRRQLKTGNTKCPKCMILILQHGGSVSTSIHKRHSVSVLCQLNVYLEVTWYTQFHMDWQTHFIGWEDCVCYSFCVTPPRRQPHCLLRWMKIIISIPG